MLTTGMKGGSVATERDITEQNDTQYQRVDPIPTNPKSESSTASSTPTPQTSKLPIVGYPALSEFIASDPALYIFRRFNVLTARNLLYMQDELCELEEKLRDLDEADYQAGTDSSRWGLGSRRNDTNTERKLIMKKIEARLGAYQNALLAQSSMLNLEGALPKFSQGLASWIDGKKPIAENESRFLDNRIDLVSLLGGERGKDPLENFVERKWASKLMHAKERKLADPNTEHHSEDFVRRRLARLILAITFTIFLMAQIVALYHIRDNHVLRIIVIWVLAFIFATALAIWTESSNSDIFTAMAAYLAVLVVFIASNVTVDNPHW